GSPQDLTHQQHNAYLRIQQGAGLAVANADFLYVVDAWRSTGHCMLASSIGWILVASGTITAGAGLAAVLFPHLFLRTGFGVESPTSSLVFFVQHWGVLIFVVGALIGYSAYAPTVRAPVLAAAVLEKCAIALLTFFGPM